MKKSITNLKIGLFLIFCLFAKINTATASDMASTGASTGERDEFSLSMFNDLPSDRALYPKMPGLVKSPSATSPKVCLTPVILVQPVNASACLASVVSLTVVALNAYSYQWQVNMGSGYVDISNDANYSGALTSSLSLLNVSTNISGYTYRVIVSDECGNTATSNGVNISLLSPYITQNPSSATICAGSNAQFSSAANLATSYQWQVDQGSGFGNVTNGGVYSGATTNTLTITGATAAMNGYKYRNVATGLCAPDAATTTATLTVNSAPAITQNPASASVCSGLNTQFSVAASNATSYQWQVDQGSGYTNVTNGGVYSGATSSTLSITGATTAMNGYSYRVVVAGACSPNATSTGATLTVNVAPAITQNPAATNVCSGSNAQFSVTATAATSYQWQVNQGSGYANISNGGAYSGATTNTLTITDATVAMSGYTYRNVVSGACSPAATSSGAALTVNALPSITQNPAAASVCDGANAQFSITAGGSTSYQWQVDQGSGYANITNGGVYSGATTNTLTITGATLAMSGYTYRSIASGACSPAATSTGATLTVNTAPSITQNPSSSSICDGSSTVLSVTATSATGYQWQVNDGSGYVNLSNGGIYNGATSSTLIITGAPVSISGYTFRNVVSGLCAPNATSTAATITVNPAPVITQNPSAATICAGTGTSFSVTATAATSYQWQVDNGSGYVNVTNGGVYSGATTSTLTITGATDAMNGYTYRSIASGACSPAVTSTGAILTVNPAPAFTKNPSDSSICNGSGTVFTVTATAATGYQWQVNSGSGYVNVTDGGMYSGATTNTLTITGATTAMNGYAYRNIASGGCSPNATSAAAILNVLPVVTYYQDADSDGYGNPAVTTTSCTGAPTGYVSSNTDTDDTNAATNPGATEVCYDNIDNDSDGLIDENCTPLTTISSTYCGTTLEYLNTEYISANPVPGADQYEFRITNGSYSATATDNLMAGKVRIIQFAGYEYNKTYQIAVRARVNGIWADFSTAPCSITTTAFPHSEIQASQCGITLTDINTYIFTSTVNGATQYRFRVVNGSNVQIIDRPVRSLNLTMLPSYAYGTTYTISVAVQFNGVFAPYSTSCTVTTPPVTKVRANQCGTTLSAVNKLIYAETVSNVTGYRFRVTNGASVQTIDRTTNSFYLTQLASYAYATAYSIDISVQFGGVWQPYGPVCIVTTPVAGTVLTSLETPYCGINLTATSQNLIATPVTSATQYEFLVENSASGYSQSIVKTLYNFNLAQLTGIVANTTYTVRIRSRVGGVWSPYGPLCTVKTPASGLRPEGNGSMETGTLAAEAFDAVTFPNPFDHDFGVNVSTESTEMVSITVYDLSGKVLASHLVAPQELGNLRMGEGYAAGIYQIKVVQGSNSETLKVIKN